METHQFNELNFRSVSSHESVSNIKVGEEINLFINSDAILNRDALWSIQGKNDHVNADIVRGIRRTGKIFR